MQTRHMPTINARYWTAITMASLFGTNLGDLYSDTSGLGIYAGLAVLTAFTAGVFLVERRDQAPREVWYWLVIIIIRTGATNLADFLAYKVHIPGAPLSLGLVASIAGFGFLSLNRSDRAEQRAEGQGMPATGAAYWAAMLSAGVFGTVVGDIAQHVIGQGLAALSLAILLLVAFAVWWSQRASRLSLYWLTVAIARTAGTAMGDFLAENKTLAIGLALATLITGTIFVLILLLWPRRNGTVPVMAG